MIVDEIYKKFNINKLNRTGCSNSSQEGTVYLGSGNKSTVNIGTLNPHYLWGQLFDGTQDIDGDFTSTGDVTAVNGFFQNLTVTGQAHFFELVIDKIKSVGGAVILSPADGFDILDIGVAEVGGVNCSKLWFLAEDGGNKINNMWEVGDQLLIMDFNNAAAGYTYNTGNRYFWGIVNSVSTTPEDVTIGEDQVKCHFVTLDATTYDGTMPSTSDYVGASCVMLGHRAQQGEVNPEARQGAIYLSAYDGLDTTLDAPFVALYDGINDFNLSNHRVTWFSMNGSSVKGELHVYDNANERVDISPHSVGIVDDYNWNTENKTVIGSNGMYSGNTYGYFWNGPDEIDLSYGNHRLMLDSTGIKRTIRERTWNGNTKTDTYSAVPYYDISHVNNITKITPSSSVSSYDLDKDDGFVVVYNNNPQIAVTINLPDPNVSTGCRLYIKGLHDVTVARSGRIIKEGDSAAVNSVFIENDACMFICDGTYWFAFSGV